jgi:[protein-PII] uridylyltransferase
VDELLRDRAGQHLPPTLALVAVGGYGQGRLFPHSDVDLVVLVTDEQAAPRDALGAFWQQLWDAGLRPGHSVRTAEECARLQEGNLELTISLLDQRFLWGDRTRHQDLAARLAAFWKTRGAEIARRLAHHTRERHHRWQKTIYHLEPDVKESPGGWRDGQVLDWMAQLLGQDAPDWAEARQFLTQLRTALHTRAGRDANVLTFEAQDALGEPPEQLMQDYYHHARRVASLVEARLEPWEPAGRGLMRHFRGLRARLGQAPFTVERQKVSLREPGQWASDEALRWSLFEFVGRHGLRLGFDLRESPPAPVSADWARVSAVAGLPQAAAALRAMAETGALPSLIPEWTAVEGRVVRDFYHRYTVDEHTLVALEEIGQASDARIQGIRDEIDRLDLLRLALLFHDLGKGGGNHATESARIAAGRLREWGAPEADVETIVFLVREHLALSQAMTQRDLSDPATARQLAHVIGSVERLRLLTVMTYADISAVYPGAMTPWRTEQLWRAYLAVHNELTAELETERIPHDAAQPEFLEGFPTRYLHTHTKAEIDRHLQLAAQLARKPAVVDLEMRQGVWWATILTADRPFLFASLAGALSGFGMNIRKAEAFSNQQGIAMDTFAFEDPHRALELNVEEVDRLRQTLAAVAQGQMDVPKLLKGRRPAALIQPGTVRPAVTFNNKVTSHATLVEIVAGDRPGLLYDLANAISRSGCDIDVVLIDTEAHKALDVFYVQYGGKKMPEELHGPLRESLLAACGAG